MIIVGIDPGLDGAIAGIECDGGIGEWTKVRPMPTLKATKNKRIIDETFLCAFLGRQKSFIHHVFIEKVSAMPKQGVTSSFNFGAGWGLIRGMCVGLGLPYTLVHPTTWKKTMCRDMPKGSKEVSIIVAKRLWPHVSLKRTPRSRKDSDGMADALLIAEYGRRSLALHPKKEG